MFDRINKILGPKSPNEIRRQEKFKRMRGGPTPPTDNTPPNPAPSNLQASSIGETSLQLFWNRSQDDTPPITYNIEYRISGVGSYTVIQTQTQTSGTQTGTTGITISNLQHSTTYDFRINATDSVPVIDGGPYTSGYSNVRTVTTATPTDVDPPTAPFNLFSSAVGENTANLTWDGSDDNLGVNGLQYKIFKSVSGGPFSFNGPVVNHVGAAYAIQSTTKTGLIPGTQQQFYVIAEDAAGLQSSPSNTITFTTADNTSPSNPSSLTANNTTDTTTGLSWNAATDNVDVTSYKIYQDGLSVIDINAPTTNATITGLTPNTSYAFYVTAFDAALNESTASNTFNVLTSASTPAPTSSIQDNSQTIIKIPRIASNGIDHSTTLSQLNNLSIPFTNGEVSKFKILQINPFPNYFTYIVEPLSGSKVDYSDTGSVLYDYEETINSGGTTYPGMSSTSPFPLNTGNTTFSEGNRAIQRINQGGVFGGRINTLPQTPFQITASISSSVSPGNNYQIGIYSASYSGTTRTGLSLITSSAIQTTDSEITLQVECEAKINQYFFVGFFRDGSGGIFNASFTGQMEINSPQVTGNILGYTFEPYLTKVFQNSDAEVLLNNVNQYPTNKFLQDLDYSTSATVATNYPAVLIGSASKGTVPRSYYTSLSSLIPKYIGAKNQSSNFNVYNPTASLQWDGEPTNIGTFGQLPSVDSKDNTIVEFDWAGGTNPEIPFGGSFKLSNLILEVSDISSVRSVVPGTNIEDFTITNYIWSASNPQNQTGSFPPQAFIEERDDYYNILNNTYPIGSQLVPIQYASSGTPILPKVATVIENSIEIPTQAIYAGTSSYYESSLIPRYANWGNQTNTISFINNSEISILNSNYVPTSSTSSLYLEDISNKLKEGERWFITLYNNFEFPVNVDNPSQIFSSITTGDNPPLNSRGVFEIVGTYIASNTSGITLILKPNTINNTNQQILIGGANPTSVGFLIWKSTNNYLQRSIIVDNVTSGVTAGGFFSTETIELIRNDFNSITRQFGNNTSN